MDPDKVNQYFESVSSLREIIGEFKEKYGKETEPTLCLNPFYTLRMDYEDAFLKLRGDLIESVASWYMINYCPNVSYRSSEFHLLMDRKVGREGFDARVIVQYIEEEYLANIDELSYQHIKNESASLLPGSWENGKRKYPFLEEIASGKVLKLRVDVVNHRKNPLVSFRGCQCLSALEKLIKVTMDEASPVNVRGEEISGLYWESRSFYGEKSVNGSVPGVESVRAFKNGRFDVRFESEALCMKVAKELLGYKGTNDIRA